MDLDQDRWVPGAPRHPRWDPDDPAGL